MKKKTVKRLIWIFVIGAICAAAVWTGMSMGNVITAETMAVMPGEIKQYIEETAVVRCKNMRTVYIEGSGKITQIWFSVGDTVNKDDILVTMDDTDLQLKLKTAEAAIKAAKSQIQGTDISNYANQIEIAAAALAQAEIAYNSAMRALENAQALYNAGTISSEELNMATDQSLAAQAALRAAQLQLEEAKKGVRDYIKQGYLSQLEQAVIQRDALLRSIEKQQLKSPVNGIILEKFAENYSMAVPGTPAFIIGDTGDLELEANILSDDGYKIQIGDRVEIAGKFLQDGMLEGRVSNIAPIAKTITSTLGVNQKRVEIIIEIIDKSALLKPGYNVDIRIVTAEKKGIIAVPESALFDYEGNTCLFVIQEEIAVIRQVKKGLEGDRTVEITEGLASGETILVKPDNTIKEGIKIKPLSDD